MALLLELGIFGLFLLAISEAVINPIPVETILMPLIIINPEKFILYSIAATFGSVFGASLGYLIGKYGRKKLIARFFSEKKILRAERFYAKYGAFAVFIAGFSPIPYKVFTVTSGILNLNFAKFIIASLISRASRFFSIALIVFYLREKAEKVLGREFLIITAVIALLLIALYLICIGVKKDE